MPLTEFQSAVARLLAVNRSPDSYLAGGAAIHIDPRSTRYSNDLDCFNDSVERVARAFDDDSALLDQHGYQLAVDIRQLGYVRARVQRSGRSTRIEWAHDSAWRFMPTQRHQRYGYRLHPVDLAVNKVLALVGRNEARDFVDTLYFHQTLLPLGALCWAAVGKDPGFTPSSLLDMLRRRGRHRPEEFERLNLTEPPDLPAMKQTWLEALDAAEDFIRSRPSQEIGCLYYAIDENRFVAPGDRGPPQVVPHYGRPGGVVPAFID